MVIGDRLRELRVWKGLSQGDLAKRTGLLRCYISRLENGHTVPSLRTLERLTRALEVPLYLFFYEGEEPPKLPNAVAGKAPQKVLWRSSGKNARYLHKLRKGLSKIRKADCELLLAFVRNLALRRIPRTRASA